MSSHNTFSQRPSEHRWRRGWKLLHVVPVPFSARVKRILRAQMMGQGSKAYRMAVETSRWAALHGHDVATRRMSELLTELQMHLPTAVLALEGLEAMEDAARRAVRGQQWRDALHWTDQILSVSDISRDSRGRAMRNRAMVLATLGRFQDAIAAYDALTRDAEVWSAISPVTQAALQLSRAALDRYVDGLRTTSAGPVTPLLGQSPTIWQLYWWLLGHVAWNQPKRLESLRLASIRTFNTDWDWRMDRLLWGLDLQIGWPDERKYYEERLSQAINDDRTIQVVGRSGWLDLQADWIYSLMDHGAPEARSRWEQHISWCRTEGYDGWVTYWEAHQPE